MIPKNAQHTPGPWRVTYAPEGRWVEVYGGPHEDDVAQAVGMPNARLIAAAPELLEALDALLAETAMPEADSRFPARVAARAAIAKAKGGRE